MNKISKALIQTCQFLLILLVYSQMAMAQTIDRQLMSSAGTQFSTADFNLDYSIGEPIIIQLSDGVVEIQSGFQQGEKISGVFVMNESKPEVKWSVFPNPFREIIQCNLENTSGEPLSIYLIDLHGKICAMQQINGENSIVRFNNLNHLPYGPYSILIEYQGKILASVKLVK